MPAQKTLFAGVDPPPFGSFLDFTSDDGIDYIVRDINAGGANRWTLDHPELQFHVAPKPALHFVLDFIVAGETFRSTGPVTVTVKVNGNPIGWMRCDHAGEYHFDKPVSLQPKAADTATRVIAEANPLWVSPSDGVRLGYLMLRAGFRW